MAVRTREADVIELLGVNYDSVRAPSCSGYMKSASKLVDKTITAITDRGLESFDSETAELIERWLSAYFYTKMDPLYTSRSTGGASGSFQQGTETPNPYREAAEQLDTSGQLRAILKGNRASALWLGKSQTDQLDFDQRN